MCRELMSMVSHLRDVGANAVLDLPQVIVAGNQSAGKSSLLGGCHTVVLVHQSKPLTAATNRPAQAARQGL